MSDRETDVITGYLREVFAQEDEHLRTLMPRAIEAGLPDIAVSPEVGRMLSLLTSMAGPDGGPARRALELGTLAGYSGTWIARALAPGGMLTTLEPEARHADFARRAFDDAGVGDRVTIVREAALDVLPRLLDDPGAGSFDVVFIDAIKREYPAYWTYARELVSPGGLVMVDNALRSDHWEMSDPAGVNESRDGADAINRAAAGDPGFEALAIPIGNGVLVARKKR